MLATAPLLFFYGLFLIGCGIGSVIFIGKKAKTALISGGTAGTLAIVTGHYVAQQEVWAQVAGFILSLVLGGVFLWRSTKTLFALLEQVHSGVVNWKPKAIAFQIISLMTIVSVIITLFQGAIWFSP